MRFFGDFLAFVSIFAIFIFGVESNDARLDENDGRLDRNKGITVRNEATFDRNEVIFDPNEARSDLTKASFDRENIEVTTRAGGAEEEAYAVAAMLKRMMTMMEDEAKRTIRLETRIKSLEFKAEVDARETRTLKSKLDSVLRESHEMKKQLTKLSERDPTNGGGGSGGGGGGGDGGCCCGNSSTVAKEESVTILRENVDKVATAVERVEQKVML